MFICCASICGSNMSSYEPILKTKTGILCFESFPIENGKIAWPPKLRPNILKSDWYICTTLFGKSRAWSPDHQIFGTAFWAPCSCRATGEGLLWLSSHKERESKDRPGKPFLQGYPGKVVPLLWPCRAPTLAWFPMGIAHSNLQCSALALPVLKKSWLWKK